MAKETDYRANALIRGLAILHSFDQRHPEMSLSEIAEAISVTSSAAYRFVVTLEQEGYLERRENRYRLAPRVMDLGYRYLASTLATLLVLVIVLVPAGLICTLAVMQGLSIVDQFRAADIRGASADISPSQARSTLGCSGRSRLPAP